MAAMSVDMQHYSCPTRLVDWTSSPYMGLYFAVNENFDNDGVLYVWDNRFYDRKMKDLHNDYSGISSQHILNFSAYDIVSPLLAIKKNKRLAKQQGLFTISNNLVKSHCDLITEIFAEGEVRGLYKLQIPQQLKFEFLARLRIMNITADSASQD